MTLLSERLERFARVIEQAQRERYAREYPTQMSPGVAVHPGRKYIRVDVGDSGKYMVVVDTGEIYAIKAYGVIHRGHSYGTLDTIDAWDWSGYVAVRR